MKGKSSKVQLPSQVQEALFRICIYPELPTYTWSFSTRYYKDNHATVPALLKQF